MGTSYSITLVDSAAAAVRQQIAEDATGVLEHIEARMSTWLPDSEISLFNQSDSTDWMSVSEETLAVLSAAQDMSRLTAGAFDVTVGPLVDLWGFGPRAMREEPPDREEIDRIKKSVGFEKLSLRTEPPAVRKQHPDVHVDLSAIAKGYAVDRLASLLDDRGISHYLVEIGGELRARGRNARGQKWKVAVERPLANQRSLHRILHIDNQAVATSGNYRNFFDHAGQRYSHTIDPRTGAPVTHSLASVTVVERSAMLADALATAFTVLGPVAGFDLATERGIAALFIVATDEGLEELSTPSFATVSDSSP